MVEMFPKGHESCPWSCRGGCKKVSSCETFPSACNEQHMQARRGGGNDPQATDIGQGKTNNEIGEKNKQKLERKAKKRDWRDKQKTRLER